MNIQRKGLIQEQTSIFRRNINQLWQVLLYARRVFYKIDTKCPLNEEAASL